MMSRSFATSSSLRLSVRVSGLSPAFATISFARKRPMPKMYVSAISIRLLRGKSTPAIRAIPLMPPRLSALALLVARVGADHAHGALAADDLALATNTSDGCSNFHDLRLLLGAVGD